jgi:predicted DNA-binding transcriptional regulator YafY
MKVNYTNYKNENSDRNIIPLFPYFAANSYHPDKQWLLKAWDLDKKALRSFAVRDIKIKNIL